MQNGSIRHGSVQTVLQTGALFHLNERHSLARRLPSIN